MDRTILELSKIYGDKWINGSLKIFIPDRFVRATGINRHHNNVASARKLSGVKSIVKKVTVGPDEEVIHVYTIAGTSSITIEKAAAVFRFSSVFMLIPNRYWHVYTDNQMELLRGIDSVCGTIFTPLESCCRSGGLFQVTGTIGQIRHAVSKLVWSLVELEETHGDEARRIAPKYVPICHKDERHPVVSATGYLIVDRGRFNTTLARRKDLMHVIQTKFHVSFIRPDERLLETRKSDLIGIAGDTYLDVDKAICRLESEIENFGGQMDIPVMPNLRQISKDMCTFEYQLSGAFMHGNYEESWRRAIIDIQQIMPQVKLSLEQDQPAGSYYFRVTCHNQQFAEVTTRLGMEYTRLNLTRALPDYDDSPQDRGENRHMNVEQPAGSRRLGDSARTTQSLGRKRRAHRKNTQIQPETDQTLLITEEHFKWLTNNNDRLLNSIRRSNFVNISIQAREGAARPVTVCGERHHVEQAVKAIKAYLANVEPGRQETDQGPAEVDNLAGMPLENLDPDSPAPGALSWVRKWATNTIIRVLDVGIAGLIPQFSLGGLLSQSADNVRQQPVSETDEEEEILDDSGSAETATKIDSETGLDSTSKEQIQSAMEDVAAPITANVSTALENTVCSICFDESVNTALVPCGHLNFCADCANTAWKAKKGCPICRSKITSVLRVFSG